MSKRADKEWGEMWSNEKEQEVEIMTNGSAIKMNKGKFTRTFWLFEDGTAKEYTNEGLREITCDFTTLYALLQRNGWKEV